MYAFLSAVSAFVSDRFEKKNDRGATAVEYGIMVAAIAAVIIAIVFLIGDEVTAAFQTVLTNLQAN